MFLRRLVKKFMSTFQSIKVTSRRNSRENFRNFTKTLVPL
jgi:hypothetical protein